MAEKTEISWTDATFNPWMGCTKVGPGCDHCYAEATMDTRYGKVHWGAGQPRVRTGVQNWNLPKRWNGLDFAECTSCDWRGERREFSKASGCPGCRVATYKPARRRVFCSSLADVFDNEVDPDWRADLWALIRATPYLDWLLLTKRIGNVQKMLPLDWRAAGYQNVWLGATIVNREEMLRDGPKLKRIPARVRFWSGEPLLGDLGPIPVELLPDWVIAGGESGKDARPMHPAWARSLRDQCQAAGVAFHFKQWGEWLPCGGDAQRAFPEKVRALPANHTPAWPDGTIGHGDFRQKGGFGLPLLRVGKKAAGRQLDGVEHNGFPNLLQF